MDWAQAKLQQYLHLCEQIRDWQKDHGYQWDEFCTSLNDEALQMLPAVEKIVHRMQVGAPDLLQPPAYTTSNSEQWVRRAAGSIRDREDVERHLRTEAPVLAADELHPTVWEAAERTWGIGEYDAALQQACIALSAMIRTKAHSRLQDRKLVSDVFSPVEPKPGGTRLHFPGERDETWVSRQNGLHLLAQAVFAGIRNVMAHEGQEMTQQEALEQMAVLSTLARWTDRTVLVDGAPKAD